MELQFIIKFANEDEGRFNSDKKCFWTGLVDSLQEYM